MVGEAKATGAAVVEMPSELQVSRVIVVATEELSESLNYMIAGQVSGVEIDISQHDDVEVARVDSKQQNKGSRDSALHLVAAAAMLQIANEIPDLAVAGIPVFG